MNLTALEDRVWERLEQDPDAPVTPETEVRHALNQALYLLQLLTLCLEKTASLTLTAATPHLGIRGQLTDYLVPLRLTVAGARLRPITMQDLDSLDAGWQVSAGTPIRYGTRGINLLFVYRQPATDTTALLTYAYVPAALASGSDSPGFPEEYHESLIKFALVWLRLKEGANEFDKVLPLLGEFIADAKKLNAYVRARSLAAQYDTLPFQLKLFDKSRLMKSIADTAKGAANGKPTAG